MCYVCNFLKFIQFNVLHLDFWPSMKLQSYFLFSLKVINGIYSGVTTVELDNLAAETGERSVDYKKHIVDGYDKENNLGIEFQNSKISVEDIISRDKTTEIDWIFNVEKQYIRRVNITNQIISI